MSGDRLEEATAALVAAGRAASTPAAVVEAGTWEHQRVVEATLAGIASEVREAGLGSPSLLIVGEVVSLRSRLPTWVAASNPDAGHELPRVAEAGHE
jgi:uroporphyrin-III C-methyltransferase